MTIRPTFRQADLCRALKAAAAAGLKVGRVEIVGDKFVLVAAGEMPEPTNDLDKWMNRNARPA